MSEQPARGRTALQRFAKTSAGRTRPVEAFGEVAAYGEVVWSWHPLPMSSPRRFCEPQPGRAKPSIRATAVTRGIRRARRKPLKPSRGESRVISGILVVTTVCLLPMHRGRGCSGHPAFPAPSLFYLEGQCSSEPRAHRAARMRTRSHSLFEISIEEQTPRRPGLEPGPITTSAYCCAMLRPQSHPQPTPVAMGPGSRPGRRGLNYSRPPQTQSAATAAFCNGELPISQPLLDAGGEAGHSVRCCALRTIVLKQTGSG